LDDLNTPLSLPKGPRRKRFPISAQHVLVGILGSFLAVFAVWTVMVEDPHGGEPMATASIPVRTAAKTEAKTPKDLGPESYSGKPSGPPVDDPDPPGGKTITIIDGTSGKRQQVVIPGSEGKQAGSGIDAELLEGTRYGRIPKVGASGARAVEAYASPTSAALSKVTGPRIAVIVGGLGISARATADALSRLPPAITFAFAPYGGNLADLAARARARGHEVLLQLPMEPFDYPDNDPGPQTLLTTLRADQNLSRLHWQMSRLQGYVGVMNLMGNRFMTSEKALAPVLADVAKRGLVFVDDGSSARSLASHLAAGNNMPFTKAEEVLDAVPTPAEIDHALSRLERVAQKSGIAVGVAAAQPVSVDRILHWAKGAEARGFTLVPITVAALKPRSS